MARVFPLLLYVRLRKLGATHVLDRAGEGGKHAPAGYDVIIDLIGGADLPSFFAELNPNGRMVAVGAVAGPPPADFAMEMFAACQKSMSFATFSMNTVTEPDRRAATAELFAAASRGELHTVIHELLPLEQAVLAHQKMSAGEVFGRIVLAPSGKLAQLSVPVTLILSGEAGPLPAADMARLRQRSPQINVVTITGAGPDIAATQPAMLAAALDDVLAAENHKARGGRPQGGVVTQTAQPTGAEAAAGTAARLRIEPNQRRVRVLFGGETGQRRAHSSARS